MIKFTTFVCVIRQRIVILLQICYTLKSLLMVLHPLEAL